MLIREIKRRAHRFMGPSVAICLVAYFGYHLLEGRRGLLAWQHLDSQLARVQGRMSDLQKEEDILSNRIRLLKSESICTDMLTERAKEVLGYVPNHEVVVMIPRD